ncbi:MAG: FAD-dependent oxidoreductase [Lachnospiraceae bacterium]|nr:FAD-dependent oxidoreductase [Lachnospiraceae bacterium]
MQTKSLITRNELNEKLSVYTRKYSKRIKGTPPGVCPVTFIRSFVESASSQTCGKCVPCRDGLPQLSKMLEKIIEGEGDEDSLTEIVDLATTIRDTADCAIGYEAAYVVLQSMKTFREEYYSHINNKQCLGEVGEKIPCVSYCPANVDIPGYIALIGEKRYEDAVALIRNDNPFPTACAFVCEHPCMTKCRRELLDNAINIRGLKKYAVDNAHADKVWLPKSNVSTGKTISVIGAGPSGLTAAYFLSLMGHHVDVYEAREKAGGMLRYGIPNYRLPKDRLDEDIRSILATGNIEMHYNCMINRDISMDELVEKSDAVFISIGAQSGRLVPIEGIESKGVASAVEMLGEIGKGNIPDYTGKKIVVVGGGNVAMDCARSAIRCNAESVNVIVMERQVDMTASPDEIFGAIEEGAELLTLHAPLKITSNENGEVKSFIAQPQRVGKFNSLDKPTVIPADRDPIEVPCDIVLMAIGQKIDSESFEKYSVEPVRHIFETEPTTRVKGYEKIFAAGDCVSGPATAIKAIGAGKIAAINIDEYLGYNHKFKAHIAMPEPKQNDRTHYGSTHLTFVSARERRRNFDPIENGMSYEEAMQECNKCLRCDHFGCGVLVGGDI